ncbi:Exoenzyme S synthesis regulatory protein ExsA [Photorhabdus australis subsp. thailandensis]|uniref:Exoenzyme S synthesis regulatory protein ExsA n=1 Tax=Photorhabdus australis subsp. thailandensis TaxID=2805096 RepID=A0A1C0U2I2_9GAMM|nr:AraC family transcriptional regulator [Photorhabdus australis]OCQ52128.1 Exoenzyme S synthesis regulatory protein ExsA [Photorhabdus australis subsp. thailandensis]
MAVQLPSLHLRQYSAETISHSHQGLWQFVFGYDGQLELNIEGEQGVVNSRNVVVIPPDTKHSFFASGENQQLVLELPSAQFGPLQHGDSFWQPLPESALALIKWLHDYPQPSASHADVARLLLAQLPQISSSSALMVKLDQGLSGRLHEKMTVMDMADICAISVSTLHRKLFIATGMSPMAYLKTCRMKFAYNLLVNSYKSLSDIAFLSGYASQSAFTFAFNQHYGCTPARLRKTK